MSAVQPRLDRVQSRRLAQFERMGLSVRTMPDGRSLLVSLPLGPAPLETLEGSIRPVRVVFATVGPDKIKCLRPRALFGLPLIDVHKCVDAASIEWAIREAWRERTRELRESAKQLREIGLEVESVEEGSALAFALPGASPSARVRMQRLGEAILPSTGALSGLTLDDPDQRVLEVGDLLDSGADLESHLVERVDELARRANARSERRRVRAQIEKPTEMGSDPRRRSAVLRHQPKVLLVGPEVIGDAELREELKRRGYRLATSRSETEALMRLAASSPDVVISQYVLGRSDGASLVAEMHGLAGIERIPVVLLDDARHEARLAAARAVGAAGYVALPLEPERFVMRLGRLIDEPAKRRFTRYPQRLVARVQGTSKPCLVTEVGRGGVFVSTPQPIAPHTAMQCEVSLPELGRALRFRGEVLYCAEAQGASRQGLGLRFFDISPEDEAALIEYLVHLESQR